MNVLWLLIPMLWMTAPVEDHAIYLSVIEAVVVPEGIEVEIKVFEDDLQDALRPLSDQLDIKEKLELYFGKRLSFKSTGAPVVKRHWLEGESYRIAMFFNLPEAWPDLSVSASYFMELFPTQQNILKLSVQDRRYYHIFKKPDEVYTTTITD